MLNDLLLFDPGKKTAAELAGLSRKSPELPIEVFNIAMENNYPQNWRAAWVLKGMWESAPKIVEPLLEEMIVALPTAPNNGVRREFLRILCEYPVPKNEDLTGILLSHCFDCLQEPLSPVSVKIHSITILLKITFIHPELKEELATTISLAMQEGSPGILNRGEKALRALQKL
jgi:hypothetical protein